MSAIVLFNRKRRKEYLLYDAFLDTLAAGSVNGSVATPPSSGVRIVGAPAVRTLVDTESKLSIVNSAATFAGGKASPAFGDPGLWYPAQTRVAGRVLLSTITPSATNKEVLLGFDANTAGAATVCFDFSSGSLCLNITGVILGVFSAGIAYQIAIVLRTTGAFYFIKGGAFSAWTLLWAGATDSTAILYPAVSNYNMAFPASNIRIPLATWLPTPLAQDSFARGDGAIGNTDGLGPEIGGGGLAWTGAGATIATSKAVITPSTTGGELVTNGNFAAWTGDNPNSWSLTTTEDASNYVTQVGNAARVVSNDVKTIGISQAVFVAKAWHLISITTTAVVSGGIRLQEAGVASIPFGDITTVKTDLRTYRASAGPGSFIILKNGACDVTFSSTSVQALSLPTLFASLQASTVNVMVDAKLSATTTGTQQGLVARLDSAASPANFIIAYQGGDGTVKIDECVGGAYAALGSYTSAFAADKTIRLDLSGTAWRLYSITSAGVAALLGSGVTNVNSGTLCGLFSTYSGNTFSGFTVWDKQSAYSALDQF